MPPKSLPKKRKRPAPKAKATKTEAEGTKTEDEETGVSVDLHQNGGTQDVHDGGTGELAGKTKWEH